MLAWKFFAAGAVAPFTGVPWPLPSESAQAEGAEDAQRLAAEHELDAQRDAAFAIAASGPAFAGYLFDAIRRQPYPGLCAYIAANAAAAQDGRRGHDGERTTQVQWLAKHLALTRDD